MYQLHTEPGEGPESQLRYNLNVYSLEIQDFKQGNDIGYKVKAIINLRSKTWYL